MILLAKASSNLIDWPSVSLETVESCNSWGRGQFGNPEEEERPPLEAATKQRSEDRDWEH
jgi:hypothetical protein